MHKKQIHKLLLVILFLSFGSISYSQNKLKEDDLSNIEVKYLYKYTSDTLSANRSEESMILLLNPKSSIYASEKYILAKNLIKDKLTNVGSSIVEINGNDIPKYKIKL